MLVLYDDDEYVSLEIVFSNFLQRLFYCFISCILLCIELVGNMLVFHSPPEDVTSPRYVVMFLSSSEIHYCLVYRENEYKHCQYFLASLLCANHPVTCVL